VFVQGEYVRYFGGEYEELDDLKEVEAAGSGFCLCPPLCLSLISSIIALHPQPTVSFPLLFVELAMTASHPNNFLVLLNLVHPRSAFVLRLMRSDHLMIFLLL
jgi:hypothetical protein